MIGSGFATVSGDKAKLEHVRSLMQVYATAAQIIARLCGEDAGLSLEERVRGYGG